MTRQGAAALCKIAKLAIIIEVGIQDVLHLAPRITACNPPIMRLNLLEASKTFSQLISMTRKKKHWTSLSNSILVTLLQVIIIIIHVYFGHTKHFDLFRKLMVQVLQISGSICRIDLMSSEGNLHAPQDSCERVKKRNRKV